VPTPSVYIHFAVKKPPLIRQLQLFNDDRGLLWCGDRYTMLYSVSWPGFHTCCNLSTLIVYHMHAILSRAGVGSTLKAICQSFWIPLGYQYIKKLLRRCTVCKRHSGKPYAASELPPLLKIRVQDVPLFSITGIDFTGALYVKWQNEEAKVYICLLLVSPPGVCTLR